MFVVHATRKVLDRLREPTVGPFAQSTTVLGDWYATVQVQKPHVALFVNEATLLPVLMPFAPAATLVERFPTTLASVLDRHDVSASFIEREVVQMTEHVLAKTANRSVIGIMNEFASLARI